MDPLRVRGLITALSCLWMGCGFAAGVSSLYQTPQPLLQVAPLVQPAVQVGQFKASPAASTPKPYTVQPYTRGSTTVPTASPQFPGLAPYAIPVRPNPNGSPTY